MPTVLPSLQQSPDSAALLNDLAKIENHPLTRGFLKGVEKEGLRTTPSGGLSQTAHPAGLGSALTHSQITTDFSESLVEFITPPTHLNQHALDDLTNLHRFTYQHLGDEQLWPASMPCRLPADNDIPVALYGTSNRARMKTVYREGLGLRYGRTMQTVAGLHYNFSLPRSFWAYLQQHEGSIESLEAYTTRKYFDLIRNFRRYYWLLIYLFGASPVVDKSFVAGRKHNLQELSKDTLGLPYATSLRMGDLGYQSSAQSELFVCYNTLPSYTATLSKAIHTPYPAYAKLETGDIKQLNTSLLQIENEFYSPIRPKRTAHNGETALTALCKRGVEYLEVRCLDLNPYEPVGISREDLRLVDTFLIYCLLLPSPACDHAEFATTAENQRRTVERGREPGMALLFENKHETPLKEWSEHLLKDMRPIAELLAASSGDASYTNAITIAQGKVNSPESTPSGKVMSEISAGSSHIQFCQARITEHREIFAAEPLDEKLNKRYSDISEESLQLQREEERQAQASFEDYVTDYYRQYQDCCRETS